LSETVVLSERIEQNGAPEGVPYCGGGDWLEFGDYTYRKCN
jgi:hypothetical protein